MTITIPAYVERFLKFALVLALFAQPHTVGATDKATDQDQTVDQVTGKNSEERSSAQTKKRRKYENHQTATGKNLGYSYDDFYHRHDTSACYFLGQAIISIEKDSIDNSIKLAIKDDLAIAKRYCTEDRQSRKLAIDHMRNAIDVLNGSPERGIASED